MFTGSRLSIRRRVILFFAFCTVTVLYLLIMAVGMRLLERPREDANLIETAKLIRELNLTAELKSKLEDIGVCSWPDVDLPHWTLSGSMFYSLTVITTIGYGSYAPRTQNGRSFTAFFAIIGISIVGQLLASCAHLISGIIKACRQRREIRQDTAEVVELTQVLQQRHWDNIFARQEAPGGTYSAAGAESIIRELLDEDADPALLDHVLAQVDPEGSGQLRCAALCRALLQFHIAETELPTGSLRHVASVVGVSLAFILAWSAIFMAVEGWTYRESMWFCFVTMSTIGFGDFVPHTYLGRGLCFVFIVPGLGLGAATLGAFWEFFVTKRFWLLQRYWAAGRLSAKFLEAHGISVLFKHPSAIRRERRRPRRAAGVCISPLVHHALGGSTGWVAGSSQQSTIGASSQQLSSRSPSPQPRVSPSLGRSIVSRKDSTMDGKGPGDSQPLTVSTLVLQRQLSSSANGAVTPPTETVELPFTSSRKVSTGTNPGAGARLSPKVGMQISMSVQPPRRASRAGRGSGATAGQPRGFAESYRGGERDEFAQSLPVLRPTTSSESGDSDSDRLASSTAKSIQRQMSVDRARTSAPGTSGGRRASHWNLDRDRERRERVRRLVCSATLGEDSLSPAAAAARAAAACGSPPRRASHLPSVQIERRPSDVNETSGRDSPGIQASPVQRRLGNCSNLSSPKSGSAHRRSAPFSADGSEAGRAAQPRVTVAPPGADSSGQLGMLQERLLAPGSPSPPPRTVSGPAAVVMKRPKASYVS